MVFVYGTLLPGEVNAEQVEGADDLGEAVAVGWRLMDLGPYPAIVAGEGAVRGRLLRIDADRLAILDAFEGVPTLYQRVRLHTDRGAAWAWVMGSARGRWIRSGDWRRRGER